jgi:CRP-like cAMP-binding protein
MGDKFYVVETGTFVVTVESGGVSKAVARRGPGQSFGELALLYHAPRAATITASTDAVVWGIDRLPFRRITKKAGAKKLGDYEKILQQVPGIQSLTGYERTRIAEALDEMHFAAGQVVVKQGETGDVFYIIKSVQANRQRLGLIMRVQSYLANRCTAF